MDVGVLHLTVPKSLSFLKAYFLYIALACICARALHRRYVSPLRRIPGPFIASCTRGWKVWSTYKGHTEHDHIEVHNKYGSIVRIAPNELSFASPNAAKDILAVGKGFTKTDFYKVFPPPENPDIFTEIREWKHAQMKRFAVTPYSMASIQKLVPCIEDVERQLIEKLDGFAGDSRKVCDLGDWLHYFAFDVLGEVAFSQHYGFIEQGTDVAGMIKFIDDVQFYDGIVGQVPWWDKFLRLNPILPYLPIQPKPPLLVMWALTELQKRKEHGTFISDRRDLLGQLLQAHQENPDKLGEGDVFAIAFGAMALMYFSSGAGADSTASTMQSFCHLVLSAQPIYKKLVAEILDAEKSGHLSDIITYAEAQNLPYFQACLKEAMRLRPAVGLNIQRHVPPGGAHVDGVLYPGGTRVSVNGWVLHRHQATFGEDADSFRPERWLEGNAKEMERNMYQFGGGSHLCIGRNLALLEMNKVLPQLLRRYHLQLVHPGRPLKHNTTFFVVQKGLEVFVQKR